MPCPELKYCPEIPSLPYMYVAALRDATFLILETRPPFHLTRKEAVFECFRTVVFWPEVLQDMV